MSDRLAPVVLTEKALEIHGRSLLVDGHNDLAGVLSEDFGGDVATIALAERPVGEKIRLHTDIPRLRRGGVGAQFWAAFVDPQKAREGIAARCCLEQIDTIRRMNQVHSDTFELALTAADVIRIHASGKIASLIAVEGGHAIDNSLALLRCYHALGARYMTLTHSDTIDWCDSATDEPRHHGLTRFGEEVVAEMNRLGMMVDISHISGEAMRHVLRVSAAPVIASHSSAYSIAPHPRNVPDDVLEELGRTGGIAMVNFFSGFSDPEAVKLTQRLFDDMRELRGKYPDPDDYEKAREEYRRRFPLPRGTVNTIVDHIDHIVKVAGIDCVGLGSDFDGVGVLPVQLEDVSYYPYVTQALLDRGYREEQIHKINGQNILRAMGTVQALATAR